MKTIATVVALLFVSLSSAQECNAEHTGVHATVVASRSNEDVRIRIFIVNPTDQPFSFRTGSYGATRSGGYPDGGSIEGPDYVPDREKEWRDLMGTPPNVLPTLHFRDNEETNQWTAIAVGGPTYRNMRPSVFTVEPEQTRLYCQFIVNRERIAGTFLRGELSRSGLRTRDDPIRIPIVHFSFTEEERGPPNKPPEGTR